MEMPVETGHARSCTCSDCYVLSPVRSIIEAVDAGSHRRPRRGRRVSRRDERGSARVPSLVGLVAKRTGVTPDLAQSAARHRG